LLIFLLTSLLINVEGGAALLIGSQQAKYTFNHSAVLLPNYTNNGFRQEINAQTGVIHVSVENRPIRSHTKPLLVPQLGFHLKSLESQLREQDIRTMAEQVAVILNWLRLHIEYSNQTLTYHQISQNTESVSGEAPKMKTRREDESSYRIQQILSARRADCVGLSELAVFIFNKLGIHSRFVTGVAFKKDDPARLLLEGDVLHRWIEVYYPDAGWIFSDPSGKVNYVEATYVVLGVWGEHPIEPMIQNLFGKELEILIFQNGFKLFSLIPDLDGRVGVRPNMLFK